MSPLGQERPNYGVRALSAFATSRHPTGVPADRERPSQTSILRRTDIPAHDSTGEPALDHAWMDDP